MKRRSCLARRRESRPLWEPEALPVGADEYAFAFVTPASNEPVFFRMRAAWSWTVPFIFYQSAIGDKEGTLVTRQLTTGALYHDPFHRACSSETFCQTLYFTLRASNAASLGCIGRHHIAWSRIEGSSSSN